jgi:hypothetical protein
MTTNFSRRTRKRRSAAVRPPAPPQPGYESIC